MIKTLIFLMLIIFTIELYAQQQKQIPLTDCDHPSNWCREIRETAKESYIYAQMAFNAYERKNKFKLPSRYITKISALNDSIGFAYSVFEEYAGKDIVHVIIAYRGTENLDDWIHGNIKTQQNKSGLKVYDDIRKSLDKDIPITVTGHSLGGAIAINVSLRRNNVDTYVFNTSPRFSTDGAPKQNKRVSIVEYGEINKLLRIFAKEPTQKYTSIGCSTGNPISQHSQKNLANCLTAIAAIASSSEALTSLKTNNLTEFKASLQQQMQQQQQQQQM